MTESKNFVIVGGGTAGWLTALLVRHRFPEYRITLVESAQIGILGAGEGSTPHLLKALEYVGISLEQLIQNTSCTMKNGILFDGWNQQGMKFLHGFEFYNHKFQKSTFDSNVNSFEWTSAPLLPYLAEYAGVNDQDIDILTHASLNNKSLFTRNEDPNITERRTAENFIEEGVSAVHFDAQSIAAFMSKIAQERNVERIEGKVLEVVAGEDGYISHLILEDGKRVLGDFFFDCTGFARLIIGKKFKSEWVSLKETLPAKRAMPFFMKPDSNIPPYTLAKAMERGWIWQIPLQHRYGCGYVYDPDQISDEDVKREIDSFVGEDVEIPRIFNFEPGYYRDVWVKNCLALGLSNGFVEPLEATSIMQMIFALQTFLAQKHMVFSRSEVYRANYNKQIEQDQLEIAAFIYLHYMTNKTSNDFWKHFTDNYRMPELLAPTIERAKLGLLTLRDNAGIFNVVSHVSIVRGNGLLERKTVEEIYTHNLKDLNVLDKLPQLSQEMKAYSGQLVDHKDFLISLGANLEQG